MKKRSEKTWELIRALYAGQTFWDKVIGRQNPPLWAFEEIAASNEALAIPHLTTFLLNGRNDVREAAAQVIGRLVGDVPSQDFVQLDEACRSDWSYESSATSVWRRLKPADVKRFWQLPNAVAVMGVTSSHGNGFVRDEAVKELANIFDGSELPFLLVRLNDWVGVVRESAANAVLHRIRPDYARHFLKHLRLVLRLRSCGRSQHEQILTAVNKLLEEPGAAAILREGILSPDRWLRRESFQIAIAAKSAESTAILRKLLSDADPIMRLWAARNVLRRLDSTELKPLLDALVRDRFMPVRCEALNLLAQRFPAPVPGELRAALLDTHSSVRALARHWIQLQDPNFSMASSYRQSLSESSPARQRAAVLGLGETGNVADVQLILPFLNAPLVGTRKAAIRALATLQGDRYVDEFIVALADDHPGVSNEATRALRGRAKSIVDQLLPLFRTESRLFVRKKLFRLLMTQPFWARGIFLFEALRDHDEHIVELGRQAVRVWLRRSGRIAFAPNASEVEQLGNALKASAGMLAAHEVRQIEFCLRSYK